MVTFLHTTRLKVYSAWCWNESKIALRAVCCCKLVCIGVTLVICRFLDHYGHLSALIFKMCDWAHGSRGSLLPSKRVDKKNKSFSWKPKTYLLFPVIISLQVFPDSLIIGTLLWVQVAILVPKTWGGVISVRSAVRSLLATAHWLQSHRYTSLAGLHKSCEMSATAVFH